MKITGELLKTERLKKNLSVAEVAAALKLSSKMITSLEEGHVDALPAKTFIRGFVKSYAQYLKIDVNHVMSQFQEEMGSTNPLPKNPPPITVESPTLAAEAVEKRKEVQKHAQTEATKIIKNEKNQNSYVYIGIAAVLVVLIVATNRLVDRYQKETILDQKEISKLEPLSQPTATNTPQIKTTEEKATAAIPASADATAQAANNNAEGTLKTEDASAATTPISTPQPTPVTNSVLADGFEPSSGKPIEIIIEAKKDFELFYARGNSESFSKVKLTSKQIQVIRSPNGLYLKTEDGGAFHLVVNGVDKGAAGASNKPVKLTF